MKMFKYRRTQYIPNLVDDCKRKINHSEIITAHFQTELEFFKFLNDLNSLDYGELDQISTWVYTAVRGGE